MAEIHGNKETEDVAIWYDEFYSRMKILMNQ